MCSPVKEGSRCLQSLQLVRLTFDKGAHLCGGLSFTTQLFVELRSSIAAQAARLRKTAAAIAQLDVLTSFAKLAADRGYTRPEFNSTGELLIVGGRHPVIEELLRQKGERFVPNDLCFEPGRQQLLLITGPNMGGKSTYLRQAALIVLLAQIGGCVLGELVNGASSA